MNPALAGLLIIAGFAAGALLAVLTKKKEVKPLQRVQITVTGCDSAALLQKANRDVLFGTHTTVDNDGNLYIWADGNIVAHFSHGNWASCIVDHATMGSVGQQQQRPDQAEDGEDAEDDVQVGESKKTH